QHKPIRHGFNTRHVVEVCEYTRPVAYLFLVRSMADAERKFTSNAELTSSSTLLQSDFVAVTGSPMQSGCTRLSTKSRGLLRQSSSVSYALRCNRCTVRTSQLMLILLQTLQPRFRFSVARSPIGPARAVSECHTKRPNPALQLTAGRVS